MGAPSFRPACQACSSRPGPIRQAAPLFHARGVRRQATSKRLRLLHGRDAKGLGRACVCVGGQHQRAHAPPPPRLSLLPGEGAPLRGRARGEAETRLFRAGGGGPSRRARFCGQSGPCRRRGAVWRASLVDALSGVTGPRAGARTRGSPPPPLPAPFVLRSSLSLATNEAVNKETDRLPPGEAGGSCPPAQPGESEARGASGASLAAADEVCSIVHSIEAIRGLASRGHGAGGGCARRSAWHGGPCGRPARRASPLPGTPRQDAPPGLGGGLAGEGVRGARRAE